MSSAVNHRKRSHRSNAKHLSAVGSMSRTRYIIQARKTAAKQGFSVKRFFQKIIPQMVKKAAVDAVKHD